jgi:alanine racemase
MTRSLVTIDLGAIRENARTLAAMQRPSELWAVVKADAYGHGAADVARAALEGGATAICVATVGEAVPLREALPTSRIVVLGPTTTDEVAVARRARLELAVADESVPEDVPVHLKLDTGMGRWGLAELPAPGRSVVGLMTHFATADSDRSFASEQFERFLRATEPYAGRYVRHAANSAAALTMPETRLDAVRCGIPRCAGSRSSRRCGASLPASRPATAGSSSRRRRAGSGSSLSATPTASGAT